MSECSLTFCNREAILNAKNAGVSVCKGHYQQDYNGKPFSPFRVYRDERRDANGRVCTKCDEFLPWSEFYMTSDGKNRRASCKTCVIKRIKEREAERIAAAPPCSKNHCTNPAYLIGLCKTHYGRDYIERTTTK